jgi:hypothetical protein
MNKDKISKPKHGEKDLEQSIFMLMTIAMTVKRSAQKMCSGDVK